jgi:RecG-like helicase
MSIMGRTLRRITESADQRLIRESAVEHERRHPGEVVAPIRSCTPGEKVTVSGTIAALNVRPEGSAPALEVELRDDSGHVFVVWLGRQRIPGLNVGRSLVVHGRLNCVTEHPTIYNPRYELLPS